MQHTCYPKLPPCSVGIKKTLLHVVGEGECRKPRSLNLLIVILSHRIYSYYVCSEGFRFDSRLILTGPSFGSLNPSSLVSSLAIINSRIWTGWGEGVGGWIHERNYQSWVFILWYFCQKRALFTRIHRSNTHTVKRPTCISTVTPRF